jgi:2-desacetyl-2-hydroxyethyl bacteriochlorophyllide A dehydrogenase
VKNRYIELEPRQVRLREEQPQPAPAGWVRVKVSACGICGTDLHLYEGMPERGWSYPVRPGHEVAGVVMTNGSASGAIGVGEQVVLHPLIPCGKCQACRAGSENLCRAAPTMGFDAIGGLADEIAWPPDRMVAVPGIAPEQAAILADAVASAHQALRLAALPRGGALTVLGAGGIGTHVLQLARALDPDARLTAVVRSDATAQRLDALGIGVSVIQGLAGCHSTVTAASGPQDAVIEYGAGAAALREALPMLKRGGTLVIGSMEDQPIDLGTTLARFATRGLRVVGSMGSTLADLQRAVELVTSGRLELAASVSHRFPLTRTADALELLEARPPGLMRVVVTPVAEPAS